MPAADRGTVFLAARARGQRVSCGAPGVTSCALLTGPLCPAIRNLLEHQRGVLAAECDTVAQRRVYRLAASNVRDVVEVAFGIRRLDVDSRRNVAVLHCH